MRLRTFLFLGITLVLWILAGCATEGASKMEAPVPSLKTLVADDFEGPVALRNNLGGNSGTWNLDPSDINNSYTDVDVVEMPGINGKQTHAAKLNYSVESDLPSQNGFWTELKNFDASDYDHLAFDVKGDSEKGFTNRFRLEIKKIKNRRTGEKIKGSYEVPVTAEWKTVMIPLNRITGIIDFADPRVWKHPEIARKHLDQFVIVFQDREVTAKQGTIYVDNLRFLKTGNPGPAAMDSPPRSREKTKTRLEGIEYAKFLIGRLGGFPEEVAVKKKFSDEPKKFLLEVARDTWRFFDEIVDQEHALPLDSIQLGEKKALEKGTWIGDYTNVTNIGVYLACIVSAYDLGFIDRQNAVGRIEKTVSTLEKMDYHASGFPYNYYDTTLLERTSYFVSLVDSGWLVAGLYVVKNAFPEELANRVQPLIDRGNFSFFYDPVERQMFHGYYENLEVYSNYHYGIFYTEPRIASYLAIARGEVPEEHWYLGLIRTFPESYSWQTQTPKNRVLHTTRGFKYFGGYYEWKDLKFIPSWGGSAFEALMPVLLLKETELGADGIGLIDKNHALGQRRYATEELRYPVWGMSPSSVPEGGYSEYGARPFGSKGYPAGVVTPHASVLALELEPEEVVKNLRKLAEAYPIYGEYGFYDAVNVRTGRVARKYLALDQGMILIAINNYLNQGAIRKRFHADPVLQKGEFLLSEERFFGEDLPELSQSPESLPGNGTSRSSPENQTS